MIPAIGAELAGHADKLDIKLQSLCGNGFSLFVFREVSQHVSRLQTVNAYCVTLAFPIDRVSFRTPTQNIPETRPWCIEKVTFVFIGQHDVRTREQRRFLCTFLKL